MLLPQGEFRKLLSANSADRQEIMKTLFRTGLYEKIEEHLKQKASGVKKLFEALEQERRIILETSGVSDEGELAELIVRLEQEEKTLIERVNACKARLEIEEKALTEGKRIEALFAEYASAQEANQAAQKAQEEAKARRAEWETAVRAQKLSSADAYLMKEEESCTQKQQSAQEANRSMEETRTLLEEAKRVYECEKGREKEREQALEERRRLEALSESVRALRQAQKDYLTAQQEEERALRECDDKEQKCKAYETALAELKKLREDKLAAAQEASSLATAQERAQMLCRTSLERDKVIAEIDEEDRTIARVREQIEAADQKAQAAETRYHAVEMRWQSAQAGILAVNLAADAPCPVCGSLHHPQLAQPGALPSEEERKAAKQEAETARAFHTKENLKLASLTARQESRLQRQAELVALLGQEALPTKVLKEQLEALVQKVKQATAATSEAETLKARIVKGEQILADMVKAREKAQVLYQKAVGTVRAVKAVLDERGGAVPPALMAQGALEAAQKAADVTVKSLAEAWQKADTSYQKAQAEAVKAQAHATTAAQSAVEQAEKCKLLLQTLLAEGAQLGFGSREAIRGAMRSASWLEAAQRQLQMIDETALAANDRYLRSKRAIEGVTRPDTETLAQAKQAAQEAYLAAVKEAQTQADTIRAHKRNRQKIADCLSRSGELESSYRVIGQLAGIAGGNNEKKLTFQRYVLSELLTEVAEVASVRLLKMSRHRYTLQRTDELTRRNAAGGLELEVFDHLTGLARPVGTLSGGEGFLASLALALGLADVVQSYAGGIRLDTMLIDEGFGTLDPEMLDFAISTLLELQRGGRLVGIISHVPELTERIDARLEVLQTNHGSTAVFHVG